MIRLGDQDIKRLRPAALLFLVLFTASATLSAYIRQQQAAALHTVLEENSERIARSLDISLLSQIKALNRMADRWQAERGTPEEDWRPDARSYLRDLPGLVEIGRLEPGLSLSWTEPAASSGLRTLISVHSAILRQELSQHEMTIIMDGSGPEARLLVAIPVAKSGPDNEGAIISLFDGPGLLDGLMSFLAKRYYIVHFGVTSDTGMKSLQYLRPDDMHTLPITLAATPALYQARASYMPHLILAGGTLLALLSAILFHYIRRALRQSRDLQRQSRAIIDSESMLRMSMDNAPIGMALVSTDGHWIKVNPALCALVGYSEEELLQATFQDITHPDDLDADMSHVARLLARQADSYAMAKRYIHKDGHIIWASLHVALVWNEDGTPNCFISQILDITAARTAEQEREQLITNLAASNAELERFAFIASHDLQEPLRMVCNFTSLLLHDYGPQMDDTARSYIDIAASSATRMRRLIEDLLDYARASHADAQAEIFDAGDAIDYALENLSGLIRHAGAQVNVGPMPSLSGQNLRFATLIQNLVGNALKYRRTDVPLTIDIAAVRQGDEWHFTVADNGIGMKADYCELVFEPFKRLHTQAQYSGTGMGLAICRKIVDGMGGAIWVTSAQGQGSVFHFTVPCVSNA